MLDNEISNILEKLDVNLTTLERRCKFLKKPHDFKEERKLKSSAKEKISEMERLKKEVENNVDESLDHLLDDEHKISKLLTGLKYEKHDALNNITVLELKLKKWKYHQHELTKLTTQFYHKNIILIIKA